MRLTHFMFAAAWAALLIAAAPAQRAKAPVEQAPLLVDHRSPYTAKPLAEPPSIRFGLGGPFTSQWHELGPVDTLTLHLEDEENASKCKALRVGVPRPVGISAEQGEWRRAGDEGWVWSTTIRAQGAYGLRLHFAYVNMPEGAELAVFPPDRPLDCLELFYGRGPWDEGQFYTPDVVGNMVCVEYFTPGPDRPERLPFGIDEVQHIYRDIFREWEDVSIADDSCWLDSACYGEPWLTLRNACHYITFTDGGTYLCSAQLINTAASDYTPYILTANHCISTDTVAKTVSARFFYHRLTCGGSFATSRYASYANLVRTYSTADSTLLLLQGAVPAGVAWLGWTTTDPPLNTDVVCIQHPQGSWKRISFGKKTGNASGPTSHRVVWNTNGGVTDYGSSGSALLLAASGLVVGNLCCGGSFCETPTAPDYFGKFSTAYSSGGFSSYLQSGSDDAFEPNDTCQGPAAVGAGTYNDLVVKSAAEDWYRVTVSPCTTLNVSLTFTHAWGDIDLELYDACGGSPVAASRTLSNTETLSYNNSGPAKDYFIRVYLANDTRNQYSMTVGLSSSTAQVTGKVTLEQYLGGAGQSAVMEFRQPGTSIVLDSVPITLDSGGNYSAYTTSCTYDVALKFSNWLREVKYNV
ncbi:MAG: trypsin-like peptidase domain-containing protein, partial [Fimbriimonadia bacterium]